MTDSEIIKNASLGDQVCGGYLYKKDSTYAYICSTDDTDADWGGYDNFVTGADSSTNGIQNTIDLINDFDSHPAAQWCHDKTDGGYTDWYLPAKDELDDLYNNKNYTNIGTATHWSSTEYTSKNAWFQTFYNGFQRYYNKYNTNRVRAVRRVTL